jgi:hypothetical protein
MTSEDDAEDVDVGYQRPPKTTRFKKGHSGNPAGRPPGRHWQAPYEAVLGQMVTIREGGAERRVTAAEAFVLHLAKRAVEGDGVAARATLDVLKGATKGQIPREALTIVWEVVAPTSALVALRMAKKFDAYSETARIALEPWLVEAALTRLSQPLSPADQRTVVNATRTPHKVRWPEWWSEQP